MKNYKDFKNGIERKSSQISDDIIGEINTHLEKSPMNESENNSPRGGIMLERAYISRLVLKYIEEYHNWLNNESD